MRAGLSVGAFVGIVIAIVVFIGESLNIANIMAAGRFVVVIYLVTIEAKPEWERF